MDDLTDKDISAQIEAVNEQTEYLSEWERQFMRDVIEEWRQHRVLSEAQRGVLAKLFARI